MSKRSEEKRAYWRSVLERQRESGLNVRRFCREERISEAELYRLKGDLLLALFEENQAEAEESFRRAIDIARRQGAKSLELRAVMSLSRLWQKQGKQEEARQMLAEIYGWFTEGFDTADLKEAKELLQDVS